MNFFIRVNLTPEARFWIAGALVVVGILLSFILPLFIGALIILAGGIFLSPRGISNVPPPTDAAARAL